MIATGTARTALWLRHHPFEAVTAMTAQEFQLIEAFLNRRLDLPHDQRKKTAIHIADHMGTRLNVPPADPVHLPGTYSKSSPGNAATVVASADHDESHSFLSGRASTPVGHISPHVPRHRNESRSNRLRRAS